jgi:hypothetical protein
MFRSKLILGLALFWLGTTASAAESFKFVVLGDTPYSQEERDLIGRIGQSWSPQRYAFAIHVGDLKKGSALCDDKTFHDRRTLLDSFVIPTFVLFGDNDWTDCHRTRSGRYDPIERLQTLRKILLSGNQSLGQKTFPLQRQTQPSYPENTRWEHQNVLFTAVHVVGSGNNIGNVKKPRAEYLARNKANLAWLHESFMIATKHKYTAMVVAFHADPLFELPQARRQRAGFNEVLNALAEESRKFAKPVLLIHGDTHQYRVDKPLKTQDGAILNNVTRLEPAGSPWVAWVEVTVDIQKEQPFIFENHSEGLFP